VARLKGREFGLAHSSAVIEHWEPDGLWRARTVGPEPELGIHSMNHQQPVQFGIVGVGRIAANAFAPALAASANAELAAAASRNLDRAQALRPKRAYDRYEALLDDPDVEAVYIATHNGLHHPLTTRAIERGKHVLCEKPLACSAAEGEEMVAAARAHARYLTEAFMYRYHPQMAEARSRVESGAIGDVRTVEASFSFWLKDESDVRFNAEWGGGSVYDVGCYCVNACRCFLGGMPRAVTAMATFHAVHRVDLSLQGLLDFGAGRYGVVSCGFDGGVRNRVSICGTNGTLTLPRAFANSRKPTTLVIDSGGQVRESEFAPTDVYQLEIEDFARAVRGGPAPMLEPEEGLRNARIIDALLASARDDGVRVVIDGPASPPGPSS
jgi:xylose dehydrogenase (NAD/NADP)